MLVRVQPPAPFSVNVVGQGFSIGIEYHKVVTGLATQTTFLTPTWIDGYAGQTSDSSYILTGMARGSDRFVDEYLRVNEDACK